MAETNATLTHIVPHRRLHPLPVGAAHWTAGFWAERFQLCHEVIVHSMQQALDEESNAARFSNFYVAAGLQQGEHKGRFWSDGDCYKWMEALSHLYGITRDPELDRTLDERIAIVAQAQEPDGYINTQIQIPKKERYILRNHHEEYNFGHLFTAACVHQRVTGKANFLQIAIRAADLLWNVFFSRPRHLVHFGFNPSQIMGLVDLYRATGNRRYLELADIFVTNRGAAPEDLIKPPEYPLRGNGDQNQDRVPLRQETGAEGHVVTATYLYAGAADVYMETGDDALLAALRRIWADASEHKTFITGGSALLHHGASSRNDPVHEAYGLPYHLHNASAYNETCATIGNAMWAWRMLGITGEAAYADAMERVIYNGMLSAMSLDGKRFFYTNPLRWHADNHLMLSSDAHERWYTFKCYCCPPQVARAIAWMQDWAYSLSDEGVSVNLFGSSRLEFPWGDGETLALHQDTDYPWDGRVTVVIDEAPTAPLAIMLRIPGWSRGATILINDQPTGIESQPGTFARIERAWATGDTIALDIPMPIRLVKAHPHVEEARNHVAVLRGPVVYCLEAADLPLGVTVPETHIAPEDLHRLMQLCTDLFVQATQLLKQEAGELDGFHRYINATHAGAALSCEDCCVMLSPKLHREFGIPYTRQAFDRLGGGWVHFCGDGRRILDDYLAIPDLHGILYGQLHLNGVPHETALKLIRHGKGLNYGVSGRDYVLPEPPGSAPQRAPGEPWPAYFRRILAPFDRRKGIIVGAGAFTDEPGVGDSLREMWHDAQDQVFGNGRR